MKDSIFAAGAYIMSALFTIFYPFVNWRIDIGFFMMQQIVCMIGFSMIIIISYVYGEGTPKPPTI